MSTDSIRHTGAEAPDRHASRISRCALFRAISGVLLASSTFLCGAATSASATTPAHPATPQYWPVQTCNDTTTPGSLRYIAAHALPGDVIDFSQTPMACGVRDSVITLDAGEIVLHQADITLLGPDPSAGTVTLDANGASRVLRHQMYSPYDGTLEISNLRITGGRVHEAGYGSGGCVFSDANVSLYGVRVANCNVHSDTGNAYGGAVATHNGDVSLTRSLVSGNAVEVDSNANAFGGGVKCQALTAKYSEVSGNRASGGLLGWGEGGGIKANSVSVAYSTIADNYSSTWGGAIFISSANLSSTIVNSTFSGNQAFDRGGALWASMPQLEVGNSTIAFNGSGADNGGVYFKGMTADFRSTIIGKNTSVTPGMGVDLYLESGTLTGSSNLVMSSNTSAQGVIVSMEDPKLAALGWGGGVTRTHMLLEGSPAIGAGDNSMNRTNEQRGLGYSRTSPPNATVDIGAVQFEDRIFRDGLDDFYL